MKKNILLLGVFNPLGQVLAKTFKAKGYYIYGLDKKEDYEGLCDRTIRFDTNQFVLDANYRIRFTQIFEEVIPRLDVLIINNDVEIRGRLNDIQLDNWHESMNGNVAGPMLLCKLFYRRLVKSKGSILFVDKSIDSIADSTSFAYKTARFARKGLSDSLAIELKGKIKVDQIEMLNRGKDKGSTDNTGQSHSLVAEMVTDLLKNEGDRVGVMFKIEG